MSALKVRVEKGRISGQAPAGLPDGEHELCLAEPEDTMTEAELEELNSALEAAWQSIKAGRYKPAQTVLAELRERDAVRRRYR
jgi:hypothetical protein